MRRPHVKLAIQAASPGLGLFHLRAPDGKVFCAVFVSI
jgi:hypothetical protein